MNHLFDRFQKAHEHAMTETATREVIFDKKQPKKTASTEFKRSLAIVIGIDSYSNGIPPLTTAVNDARELARILKAQHDYETMLLTEDVTKSRLEAVFKEQKNNLSENDRLLVYFAGHGVAQEGDNGPKGFLVTQDINISKDIPLEELFWPMTELHKALDNLPCRHVLVILDCCFAGAFRWSSTRDVKLRPSVMYRERYERFIRSSAWQVVTSAAHNQKALDVLCGNVVGERGHGVAQKESQSHSPFALSLFKALDKELLEKEKKLYSPADSQRDGVVTATELYIYLRDQVEVNAEQLASHQQTPGLWPLNKHRHGEFIFLVPGGKVDLPPAPDLTEKNNPYKGLSPYEADDSKLFFGRTALVNKLKRRVEKLPFTVVLGASGTGKSSLVKAGLIPSLKSAAAEQNQEICWRILPVMRPGAVPLSTLRSVLVNELAAQDGGEIVELIKQWCEKNPGTKLLLVLDQFEELITLCRQEQERQDFVRELTQALAAHGDVLRIVLTLRSDFEAQISQNYLKDCWRQNKRFVVPPMTQNELREVIEQPASVMVLYFEPHALIDRLINEVIQTPGALPLLSFTLSELYLRYVARQKEVEQEEGDRALTGADYEEIGGVIGSLRRRIDQEYESLDAEHQATMRRILLRMVAFEGGGLTRRRVPKRELEYPDAAETKRGKKVVAQLSQARLIVEGSSEKAGGGLEEDVEPAHDALIVAWDKLLEWQKDEAENMLLHRQLTRAAADWEDSAGAKDRNGLLWDSSPRLLRVQEILEQKWSRSKAVPTAGQKSFRGLRQFWRVLFPTFKHLEQHIWLNQVETDFVRRSVEKKRNWRRRVAMFIIAVILSLSAIAFVAWQQKGKAISALASEKKQREKAEENLRRVEAVQLAIESTATFDNTKESFYSWGASGGARDEIKAPSFTAPLRLAKEAVLKTLTKDNYVTREAFDALRKSVEMAPPWKASLLMGQSSPCAIAWSPNGDFLAAISGYGRIYVWKIIGDNINIIGETTIPVGKDELSFSDTWLISWCGNSHFLISGAENISYLFDIARIESPTIISNEADTIAVCNQSGTQIALRKGDKLFLSKVNNLKWNLITNLHGETTIFSFSQDDKYLAFISEQSLHIQSLVNEKEKYSFQAGKGYKFVNATWNSDVNNIRLLATQTKECDMSDEITNNKIINIERIFLEKDNSGFIKKLMPDEESEKEIESSLLCGANMVAFSPDNRWIATAHGNCDFGMQGSSCTDVAVRIWNAETGDIVREMYGHTSNVTILSWHPDSHSLASGGLFNGGAGNVPDNRILIWGIEPLWNINGWESAKELFPHAVEGWISTAFFGQDKNIIRIAVTSGDCTACQDQESDIPLLFWHVNSRRWDYNGWQWTKGAAAKNSNLSAPTITLQDILPNHMSKYGQKELFWLNRGEIFPAYSEESWESDEKEGETKKKTEAPNVVRITDQESGKTVRLIGHESWVSTAEWSPDGNRVLTSSSDGTVRIWDAESGMEMGRYNLDVATFARATWSPDGKWILVGYPNVIIWPADVNELLKKAESLIKALDEENALNEEKQEKQQASNPTD